MKIKLELNGAGMTLYIDTKTMKARYRSHDWDITESWTDAEGFEDVSDFLKIEHEKGEK